MKVVAQPGIELTIPLFQTIEVLRYRICYGDQHSKLYQLLKYAGADSGFLDMRVELTLGVRFVNFT